MDNFVTRNFSTLLFFFTILLSDTQKMFHIIHDCIFVIIHITGKCVGPGYDFCCSGTDVGCKNDLAYPTCYCDANCIRFRDCCSDYEQSCLGFEGENPK